MNLRDLIDAHLEGEMDEAGQKRLGAILRANPAARSIFAAALRQEVLLAEVLGEEQAALPARRRAPWKVLAAVAAALAVAAGIWAFLPGAAPSPVGRVERVDGTAWIVSAGDRARAAAGMPVAAGARIETEGLSSRAEVRLEDGTRLRLDAGSRATLSGDLAFLEGGMLAAEVARRPAGRPFAVGTPQAEARVLGTRFVVSVERDQTLLKVEEGRILLRRKADAAAVEVKGGQYAVAASGVPLEPRPLPRAEPPERCPVARVLRMGSRPPREHFNYRLTEGAIFYGDRGYEISTVPPALRGHWGIITCQEDMRSEEGDLLVFEVQDAVDVYVGYDSRAMTPVPRLPRWMEGFRDTGMRIFSRTAGDTTYHVYRRRASAGRVALGGNHQGGDTGARENYIVIVTPEGALR